jgi:phage shock protein C
MSDFRSKSYSKPWTRSASGPLAGVCRGLAQRFELDVTLVRLGLIIVTLLWGFGVLFYLCCWIGFPREDRWAVAHSEGSFMGVCLRFARRFQFDVGLVRATTVGLFFATGGTLLFVYVILYFVLPTLEELKS